MISQHITYTNKYISERAVVEKSFNTSEEAISHEMFFDKMQEHFKRIERGEIEFRLNKAGNKEYYTGFNDNANNKIFFYDLLEVNGIVYDRSLVVDTFGSFYILNSSDCYSSFWKIITGCNIVGRKEVLPSNTDYPRIFYNRYTK